MHIVKISAARMIPRALWRLVGVGVVVALLSSAAIRIHSRRNP